MDKIKVGQQYQVKRLSQIRDKNYRNKLLSMGLMPGAIFSIVRVAPFGDPVELRVNDFSLSLRLKELLQFELEAVSA